MEYAPWEYHQLQRLNTFLSLKMPNFSALKLLSTLKTNTMNSQLTM